MAEPIPLYRFMDSDGGLKTLVAGELRVGQLSKFNDPFEWQLGVAGIASSEEQTVADGIRSEHRPWVESWMGVLCFSDSASDPVLWSLYSEKHRGVAFEIKYPWKDDQMQKMTYSNERPILNFADLRKHRDPTEREEYLKSLLRRLMNQKSLGFAFEREYRLSIDLNDRKFCRVRDGQYYWKLPEKSLARVILGFCCPLEDIAVRKLLDMNGFTDTKIARAKMCSETYTIKC
jgi:hypothetical protein